MVAAAIIGSAVVAGGASILGSQTAAGAARDAAGMQQAQYRQTRADLQPYNVTGQNALGAAWNLSQLGPTGGGPDYVSMAQQNLPGRMSQAELEQTPGYQFDLSQGLKAVQGAAAARGLGVSGASMKGAGTFATGLANKTYLDQFNVRQKMFENYVGLNTAQQGNLTNTFNRYNQLATLGANAAAQVGTQGTALTNQAGKYTAGAGIDEATGYKDVSKAINQGVNNYLAYNQYDKQTSGYEAGGKTKPYDSSPVVKNEQNDWV